MENTKETAHVLLNLISELRERDKMRGLPSFINSTILILEHECEILLFYVEAIIISTHNVFLDREL